MFSPQMILARIFVLCTAIPIHEFAHAWAAEKLGDPTAKWRKRLSLNPLNHIDPVGALMILLFGIGFARAVPINSLNFRDRKKGIILTSLAGPGSNILMALVCLALQKLLLVPYLLTGRNFIMSFIMEVFGFMVSVNLSLGVFNLLPIPPLDGWHVLSELLPREIRWKIEPYEQQLVWVVLLLVVSGALGFILNPLNYLLYSLIDSLTFFLDFLPRLFF